MFFCVVCMLCPTFPYSMRGTMPRFSTMKSDSTCQAVSAILAQGHALTRRGEPLHVKLLKLKMADTITRMHSGCSVLHIQGDYLGVATKREEFEAESGDELPVDLV